MPASASDDTQDPSCPTPPHEHPPVEDTEHPPVEDTEHPPVEDTEHPAIEDTEHPPVEDTEHPAVEDTEHPPVEDTEPARHSTGQGLVLVSTPIGNLGDISARALEALRGADLILCEDTRHTQRLLTAHGIGKALSPLHDHNEEARLPGLLSRLGAGLRAVLVSDAGTPLVSDPGYRLVRAAIAAGIAVSAVPGPNAAIMALTLSGLPPHPFLFLGFPPPRQSARVASFVRLRAAERAGLAATLIWHEAPHRLAESLADLVTSFGGERPAAVARELTKRFEEVRRDDLAALAAHYAQTPPRGEITLVVGPAPEEAADDASVDGRLVEALATMSLRDAAALVAGETGRGRGEVYARALVLRGGSGIRGRTSGGWSMMTEGGIAERSESRDQTKE